MTHGVREVGYYSADRRHQNAGVHVVQAANVQAPTGTAQAVPTSPILLSTTVMRQQQLLPPANISQTEAQPMLCALIKEQMSMQSKQRNIYREAEHLDRSDPRCLPFSIDLSAETASHCAFGPLQLDLLDLHRRHHPHEQTQHGSWRHISLQTPQSPTLHTRSCMWFLQP